MPSKDDAHDGAAADEPICTGALPARDLTPRCPFCGSPDVEPMALFGSQLLTEQYYCRACHTPFERVRDDA